MAQGMDYAIFGGDLDHCQDPNILINFYHCTYQRMILELSSLAEICTLSVWVFR